MLVDLVCIRTCYQPVLSETPHHCAEGVKFPGVEITGEEGYLKYFNAYKAKEEVVQKPIEGELLDFGNANKEDEEKPEPSATDIGAGTQPSVDKVVEKLSVETMVNLLKENGLKIASKKWKPEKLAENIIKRQLHVGKL